VPASTLSLLGCRCRPARSRCPAAVAGQHALAARPQLPASTLSLPGRSCRPARSRCPAEAFRQRNSRPVTAMLRSSSPTLEDGNICGTTTTETERACRN